MGASAAEIRHMNGQLSILQAITQNFVHRVGREQLIRDLPTKHEHVVLLRLSSAQEAMYSAFLEVRSSTHLLRAWWRRICNDYASMLSH